MPMTLDARTQEAFDKIEWPQGYTAYVDFLKDTNRLNIVASVRVNGRCFNSSRLIPAGEEVDWKAFRDDIVEKLNEFARKAPCP